MTADREQFPHREMCGLCHRESAVGFWVPDAIWHAVVHASRAQDIHCLTCFIERADAKLVRWDRGIVFYPVSFRTHISCYFEEIPDAR